MRLFFILKPPSKKFSFRNSLAFLFGCRGLRRLNLAELHSLAGHSQLLNVVRQESRRRPFLVVQERKFVAKTNVIETLHNIDEESIEIATIT